MKIYKVTCCYLNERSEPTVNDSSKIKNHYEFGDIILSDEEPFERDGNEWLKFKSEKDGQIRYVCFRNKTDYNLKQVTNRFEIAKYKKKYSLEETKNNNEFISSTEQIKKNDPFNVKFKFEEKKDYITQSIISSIPNNINEMYQENLNYDNQSNILNNNCDKKEEYEIKSINFNNLPFSNYMEIEESHLQLPVDLKIGQNNNQSQNIINKKRKYDKSNIYVKIHNLILKILKEKIKNVFSKIIKEETQKDPSNLISLIKSQNNSNNNINKTIESLFNINIKCENNIINIIKARNDDNIYEFLNMDFLYFLKSLEIYLKNNNFSNIENEDDWKNLKRNLEKKNKKDDMDIEELIDNNKILKSLLEDFRKNINDYLSKKEGKNKEFKEALILGIEDYFDKSGV